VGFFFSLNSFCASQVYASTENVKRQWSRDFQHFVTNCFINLNKMKNVLMYVCCVYMLPLSKWNEMFEFLESWKISVFSKWWWKVCSYRLAKIPKKSKRLCEEARMSGNFTRWKNPQTWMICCFQSLDFGCEVQKPLMLEFSHFDWRSWPFNAWSLLLTNAVAQRLVIRLKFSSLGWKKICYFVLIQCYLSTSFYPPQYHCQHSCHCADVTLLKLIPEFPKSVLAYSV